MSGHTLGPWKSTSGFVATQNNKVICSMARAVSVMNFAAEPGTTEDSANARLIAACPIMAEYVIMRAKEGDEHAKKIADTAGLTVA